MDDAITGMGCVSIAVKDYIWGTNENRFVILHR